MRRMIFAVFLVMAAISAVAAAATVAHTQWFSVSVLSSRPHEAVFDNSNQPWPFTSQVLASAYNTGGQGIAYNTVTRTSPPCNVNGSAYRADYNNFKTYTGTQSGIAYQVCGSSPGGVGDWHEYTVNVSQTGPFALTVWSVNATGGAVWAVSIDGTQVTTITIPGSGDFSTVLSTTSSNFNVAGGTHILRITAIAADPVGSYVGDFVAWQGIISAGPHPIAIAPPSAVVSDTTTTGATIANFVVTMSDASTFTGTITNGDTSGLTYLTGNSSTCTGNCNLLAAENFSGHDGASNFVVSATENGQSIQITFSLTIQAAGAGICSQPPPAGAVGAGMTTLVECMDFTSTNTYVGQVPGAAVTWTDLTTWAGNCGASNPVALVVTFGWQGIDCSTIKFVNYGGSQVLDVHVPLSFTAACHAATGQYVCQPGFEECGYDPASQSKLPGYISTSCPLALHHSRYIEMTMAMPQPDWNNDPSVSVFQSWNCCGAATTDASVWPAQNCPNAATYACVFLELDFLESHPWPSYGDPNTFVAGGNCIVWYGGGVYGGNGGCVAGAGNGIYNTPTGIYINTPMDPTQFHAWGYLASIDDSNPVLKHSTCGFADTVLQYCLFSAAVSPSASTNWLPGQVENRIDGYIFVGGPYSSSTDLSSPLDIYIKSLRVFTCPNWRTVLDECSPNGLYPSIQIKHAGCGGSDQCTLTRGTSVPIVPQYDPVYPYSGTLSVLVGGYDSSGNFGCTNSGGFSVSGSNLIVPNTPGTYGLCLQATNTGYLAGEFPVTPYSQYYNITVQ